MRNLSVALASVGVLVGSIIWRINWPYDIRPVQPVWCFWVASLVITSGTTAINVDRYLRWRANR